MPLLPHLEPGEPFPLTEAALNYPNGLLAAGGALNSSTLLAAYSRGIFPWYEDPQPVLWWSPDPRSVLLPENLHVSRSLRKTMRRGHLTLSTDTCFSEVMQLCAAPRPEQQGTWINSAMCRAYGDLHEQGWAHSVEVRDAAGTLVGGLYGVCLGGVFFGESMFSRVNDASKVAFVALVTLLKERGIGLIDCQVESAHLNSLGAKNMRRIDFEERLKHTVSLQTGGEPWTEVCESAELIDRLHPLTTGAAQ